jgi:phage terminase large subunit-like protein
MWDESHNLYYPLGGAPQVGNLRWVFPSGSKISFSHMQYESDKLQFQGAQIPLILFDQLEEFTEKQFWFMLSRNRSTIGIKSYIRATCNPDPESFLANLLSWWIAEDGYANLDRAGVLRYFHRDGADMFWSTDPQKLIDRFPGAIPKSMTFIPASVHHNKILLEKDPTYLASLKALEEQERIRLLGDTERGGNWKIKVGGGRVFNRGNFKIGPAPMTGGVVVRFWDFAATEADLKEDQEGGPSETASLKLLFYNDHFWVVDITKDALGPGDVEEFWLGVSEQDAVEAFEYNREYYSRWEEEPGSASKRESERMKKALALKGIEGDGIRSTTEKIQRAKPLATAVKAKLVTLVPAEWNDQLLTHLHNQPQKRKDLLDAASGAYNAMLQLEVDDVIEIGTGGLIQSHRG